MLPVVGRSRACLDHAVSLAIIHCFICSLYGGWSLQGLASLAVMLAVFVVLPMHGVGRCACIQQELLPIAIGGQRCDAPAPPPMSRWLAGHAMGALQRPLALARRLSFALAPALSWLRASSSRSVV